jgi:exodeoxyribonuclease VII small subunit
MAKKKIASKSKEKVKTPSFEEALEQLEAIVHDLEEGHVGLEESLAKYESGVKLLRHCYGLLNRAERRIELLSQVDEDGNPVTEPFDEEGTETLSEKAASRSRRRTAKKTPAISTEKPSIDGDNSPEGSDEGIDDSPLLF